jgi:hypothetical protein
MTLSSTSGLSEAEQVRAFERYQILRPYGANPGVSLAELGAGERMMDKALLNIYLLQGKFARERR